MRAPTWQSLGGDHRLMRHGLNLWPPFAASGIRVEHIGADFRTARVALHHRWWARNYVGTLFGGALFAMTDPFWMVLVLRSLGPGYVVWDRAAQIEFLAPGRSSVRAEFVVTDEAGRAARRHRGRRQGAAVVRDRRGRCGRHRGGAGAQAALCPAATARL